MTRAWRTDPQYRHLFDQLDEPVVVADENARYVDANAAACELLGYSLEELLQLAVADVVAQPPRWTADEYARFLRDRRWEGVIELRRKDGSTIEMLAQARILALPDGQQAHLSVLRKPV